MSKRQARIWGSLCAGISACAMQAVMNWHVLFWGSHSRGAIVCTKCPWKLVVSVPDLRVWSSHRTSRECLLV